MKSSHVLILTAVVVLLALGCSQLGKINGSISGTVYREGKPLMGQIQVINPRNNSSIKTEPVKNSGHFIIQDVPPGEYLLAVLGPTAAPIGEYKYVKVLPGRPLTGVDFEITEIDPKVEELRQKLAEEAAEAAAEGSAGE